MSEAVSVNMNVEVPLEAIHRARRDVVRGAANLLPTDARYVVDLYYQIQDFRKATANQLRAGGEQDEPRDLVVWSETCFQTIEGTIQSALGQFAAANPLGRWAISQYGVGPVISAGLLSHVDIARAPTAGHVWSFAGLSPHQKWEKGKKRPWNARLKVLCWKIGDSFVKFSNREACFYGAFYKQRKAIEVARNDAGEYAEIAAQTLRERKLGDNDTRKAYENGRLPDGRIDLRARRWAVKLFLAHYHHVGYELLHGEPPPRPYTLAHQGHAHYIPPPGWPMERAVR